jgi:hypothetical protein
MTLEERLNISTLDEWLSVTPAEVKKNGGGAWLQYFGGSMIKCTLICIGY